MTTTVKQGRVGQPSPWPGSDNWLREPVTVDKAPPHSRDAEEAVLGAVLINADALLDARDHVAPDDFYIVRNGWIWRAMLALTERGEAVDLVTLTDELDRAGQLTEAGGAAYLAALVGRVPTACNAAAYARIVAGTALRRRLITAASQIAAAAFDEARPHDDVLAQAQQEVQAVAETRRGAAEPEHIADVCAGVWQEAAAWRAEPLAKGVTRGLPSGLVDLDAALLGFTPGDVVVIAGRPGMGKSALAFQIGAHLSGKGYKVLAFSLEMGRNQVIRREACARARVDYRRIKEGTSTPDEWQSFTDALAALSKHNEWLIARTCTVADIEATCRRYQARYGLDAIIVDHLGKVVTPFREEYDAVSYASGKLAQLAHDMRVVTFNVCQLNRSVEQRQDKVPTMSDLRASGHIEEDADTIMALYRASYYDHTIADRTAMLYLLKTRDDAPADVTLVFTPEQTRFDNAVVRKLEA